MAQVIVRLKHFDATRIEITVDATVAEVEDYSRNMKPSHALGHRLHEALNDMLLELRKSVSRDFTAG